MKMKMRQTLSDQWWNTLSTGEKDFLRLLMTLVRGAKNSRSLEVARAARRWESGLACFIKTRLQNRSRFQ